MMYRRRRHDASRIYGEPDLAQIRHVTHSSVDHRSGVAARRHGRAHQSAHSRNVRAILDHHHVNRIDGSPINRFQHAAQCIGVSVAFVLFQQDRPRKTGKLRGEERMHAVAHIHSFTSQLFQCIRDRSHFHVAKIRK
jgi:hypothetical protein